MPSTPLSQDRLVRKEVALGTIREYEPPQAHIGLRLFAPFEEVQSDDVIFSYVRGDTAGLAPARAEDAESELAGKDESVGSGSASIIDWAQKDHYRASDVTRYREGLILGGLAGAENLSLTTRSMTEDFANKLAKDERRRRRRLDNRIEWLIMQLMDVGSITYDDGRIAFVVDGGRPAGQQDEALPESTTVWGATGAAPIEDILAIQDLADPEVVLDRCVLSRKAWRKLYLSTGFVDALTGSNPLYKVRGWGPTAAAEFIADQTNMEFIIYDAVYRTRPLGSNTTTNNRFTREDYAIFLPSQATVDEIDDALGFGKTLTAPHPEGDWSPGYYEWEDETKDPWGLDRGTGIKAFPVMPHLDMTYVYKVI